MNLRLASADDAENLLKIYEEYINTPITFEYILPTTDEFTSRIKEISNEYPYFVVEDNGKIIGYAYAHRFKEREAYQWNAELSVYLSRDYTSRGLGKILSNALIDILKLQRVKTVYSIVTASNLKSEKLQESLGFNEIGIYRKTGYKCGKWHDVKWYDKQIAAYEDNPKPFVALSDIPKEYISEIVNKYNEELQTK